MALSLVIADARPATIALIVDMPELGTMSGKECCQLAGLPRQSGKCSGKAKIGGGSRSASCSGAWPPW